MSRDYVTLLKRVRKILSWSNIMIANLSAADEGHYMVITSDTDEAGSRR
jgi:hypothetical protein